VAVLVVASLIVAPTVLYPFDNLSCWVPWAQASGGWRPWDIYRLRSDCNYPPFYPLVLTAVEGVRRLFHAPDAPLVTVWLLKAVQVAAHGGGAVAVYFGLRRPFGGKAARRAALLYAFSLALFVNAAMWGQADALLTLAMTAALIALVNERPVLAGALIGWALTIKLQAVCIAPALLVYTARRFGWRGVLAGTAAGLGVVALIALPFVLAGVGDRVLASYTGAAGFYHFRTLNAWNLWSAANSVDIYWRGIPPEVANLDHRPALGRLTYQHVGTLLYAGYLLLLLVPLWRRGARRLDLLEAAALSAVGFFLLCTQMHERYIAPGAGLLTLVAPFGLARLTYAVGFGLTAFLNQALVLYSNYLPYAQRSVDWANQGWAMLSGPMTVANLVLFAAATVAYLRPAAERAEEPPAP